MKWQNSALAAVLLAVGLAAAPQIGIAAETLKLGLSLPLSGNGSTWGLGMKWAA